MPSQEIQWTAVPYGIREEGDRTVLSCSIVVIPRLQHDTTEVRSLNDYPDWLDWPKTLKGITFGLQIGGTTIDAASVKQTSPAARSDLWSAMFKQTTPVFPYEFRDPTKGKIYSFPLDKVRAALDQVRDTALTIDTLSTPSLTYRPPQSLALKIDLPPDPSAPLLQTIATVADEKLDRAAATRKAVWERTAREKWTAYARQAEQGDVKEPIRQIPKGPIKIATTTPEAMVAAPLTGTSGMSVLHDAALYHAPRHAPLDAARTKKFKMPKPKVDFHRIIGYCRDYPRLLRLLGLVVDVDVEMPAGMADTGRMHVLATWTSAMGGTTNRMPRTAYRKATPSGGDWYWLPRPQDEAASLYNGPYYCLDNDAVFDLEQVDLDGHAIKTVEYARGVRHLATKLQGQKFEPRDITPPATRGTGITLVQRGRALHLAKRLVRAAQQYNSSASNAEVTLYAEDLMRGYRIDIWDNVSSAWQSLCRRDETFVFPGAPGDLSTGLIFEDQEGTLTNAATSPVAPPGSEEPDLYAHEGIASWDGWSLVVPRIGRYIDTEDKLSPEPASGASRLPAEPGLHLYCETSVKVHSGSLPRLRYGRTYRMRARLVDIAGNAARYSMLPSMACASEQLVYQRWDPIVSPTLALTRDPVEAESLERMVIRNYNAQDDDSVDVTTTEESRRQVLAPLSSQQTAELHGQFDSSPSGPMKGDEATYNLITNHEGKVGEVWYKRDAAGNLVKATEAEKATRTDLISYPVIPSNQAIEPPYLPDPMGRGVTLRGVPGLAAGELMEVGLSGVTMATIEAGSGVATVVFDDPASWPRIKSALIGLRSGTGKPTWDSANRTLWIEVPVGHTASLTFSSNCGENLTEAKTILELHGLWKSVRARAGSDGRQAAAARGLSWLITPGRTLTLVHATQKPLKRPRLNVAAVMARNLAASNATINFSDIFVHGRTTQKIDMHAEWDMWHDNLAEPSPRLVKEQAVVFEQHVEDVTSDKLSTVRTQEFGDTKYRAVTYLPTAASRYREYMPASILADPLNIQRSGTGKSLDIVSTKRPDTVDLVYVIPTFKWPDTERVFSGGSVSSTRKGGGLRVYMRRPWFSSGNGELLGVLLYTSTKFTPQSGGSGDASSKFMNVVTASKTDVGLVSQLVSGSTLDIPDTLHPYVTQWGLDPIWLSTPTPADNSPRVGNFVDPKSVHMNVSIDEVDPAQRLIVVGFEPMYDEARQLWYADIEIDPGTSYYPFIRLALCRYQPMSWRDNTGKDVYVSRIVQSEFCQIPPDRTATATVEADGQSVTVSVVGHTYRMNAAGQQGSEIEVSVEQRDASWGADAELGWKHVSSHRIDRVNATNAWAGLIKLPSAGSGAQYRLVVKEYEQFYSDPTGADRLMSLGAKDSKTAMGETEGIRLSLDRRIVYADILPLFAG
jgi:hypothetical protein